jgi:hypothetical protein
LLNESVARGKWLQWISCGKALSPPKQFHFGSMQERPLHAELSRTQ